MNEGSAISERNLVVVSAGLGQPSSTRLLADQLAAATRAALADRGLRVHTEVVELRGYAHDVTNHLLTGFAPAPLKRVIDTVAAADGLVAVTPIFNASYSGLFKSFFDILGPDPLIDKPMLIGATGGTGRHSLALEHTVRPMFAYLRAAVVPTAVFAAPEDWSGAGQDGPGAAPERSAPADDGALRRRIERAAAELAGEIARREPTTVADPFALTASFEQLLAATTNGGN